ncbi:MAG: hypothetical protein O2966_06165 [Proteobacteria bacterium]|nr:hypothetical protein [Pseudomonadota bacterium]
MSDSHVSATADGSCGEENFRDKVSDLVDKGKTEEAIKLADGRIKATPTTKMDIGIKVYLTIWKRNGSLL